MYFSRLWVPVLWGAFFAFPVCSMGPVQTTGTSETITVPEDPTELAQLLIERSRSRFDLRSKAFGVPEVLQAIDLAHDLRVAAARLHDDQEAGLSANKELHRELEQIGAAIERCCQGIMVPVVDRELMRYRIQEAAVLAAEQTSDKTAAIEGRRKAVAAARNLQRALMVARETGVLPLAEMLKLSWHKAEAEVALIDLTTIHPAEASEARIAVWGE